MITNGERAAKQWGVRMYLAAAWTQGSSRRRAIACTMASLDGVKYGDEARSTYFGTVVTCFYVHAVEIPNSTTKVKMEERYITVGIISYYHLQVTRSNTSRHQFTP